MSEAPRQKKIVFVTPYFPPHGGGLEQYARTVALCLERDYSAKVVVITSGEQHGKDKKSVVEGLTIYRLGYSLKVSNTPMGLLWPFKVRRIMREEAPNLVNVHTPVTGIGDIAAKWAGRVPLVVTYHAGSMQKGRSFVDWVITLYERGPM
ncbi:MAG: glycosyltransferase family 4 protein, partial [Candidatus Andersenbacteria bacterium]